MSHYEQSGRDQEPTLGYAKDWPGSRLRGLVQSPPVFVDQLCANIMLPRDIPPGCRWFHCISMGTLANPSRQKKIPRFSLQRLRLPGAIAPMRRKSDP